MFFNVFLVFFNVFIFLCFLLFFVLFNVVFFLFLLKHKRTKLQIWFISHGQIAFSVFGLYIRYIPVFSLYKY